MRTLVSDCRNCELPKHLEVTCRSRHLFGVHSVPLLGSAEASSIFTAGVLRPVIVIPEQLLDSLSAEELEVAISHEMAHVRRRDYFWNLVCELIALPVAFHPGVWWMKRRIAQTREMACDQLAASHLVSPMLYARSLLSLFRLLNKSSRSTSPALGIFDSNHLEERIMQLLDRKPRRSPRTAGIALGFSVLALIAATVVASAFAYQTKPGNSQAVTAQQFVGTWKAEFKGQTYCIVHITSGSPVVGTFSSSRNIDFGEDGNVNEVSGTEELLNSSPFLEPKIESNRLIFKWKDGDDVSTLELTLTGPDEAGLLFLQLTDKEDQDALDAHKMKPFPMKRVQNSQK